MFPLTPRGHVARSVRFNRRDIRRSSEVAQLRSVVALRIELSAASLSETLEPPALDYRVGAISGQHSAISQKGSYYLAEC